MSSSMKQRTLATIALAVGLMSLAACDRIQVGGKDYTEADIKTAHHSLNIESMTSAEVVLGTSVEAWTISAMEADSPVLIDADTESLKDLSLSSHDQTVQLIEDNMDGNYTGRTLTWTVGLTREIPINLSINSGMGEGTADLSGLQLTDLTINNGLGSATVILPVTDTPYTVHGNMGSGNFTFTVPDGAPADFNVTGGLGSLSIDVPDGAAVRVEAVIGVGNIHLPDNYARVSGGQTPTGESGAWESGTFPGATDPIVIHYEGGMGELTVQ
jgi:hypothetical protein